LRLRRDGRGFGDSDGFRAGLRKQTGLQDSTGFHLE
jgi:hypothetical protein